MKSNVVSNGICRQIEHAKSLAKHFNREDLAPTVKVGNRLWVLTWGGCFFYKCANPESDMTFYYADIVGKKTLSRSKLASIASIRAIKELGKEIGRNRILSR